MDFGVIEAMMGHGYTGGYQPWSMRKVFKKWAYLPKKSTSGKWIWNKRYYCIATYIDGDGKPPAKGLAWYTVLTENEYLLWQVRNPKKKPNLPTGGSIPVPGRDF